VQVSKVQGFDASAIIFHVHARVLLGEKAKGITRMPLSET
jgi:hypothetical protein